MEEMDFIEDVNPKSIQDNKLRIDSDDLPITIIYEGRKEYVLKETTNGVVLNKKD